MNFLINEVWRSKDIFVTDKYIFYITTSVTLELLRKRAEHNECEISTLEEISLHQQDLCRIELLDTACRDLKIL